MLSYLRHTMLLLPDYDALYVTYLGRMMRHMLLAWIVFAGLTLALFLMTRPTPYVWLYVILLVGGIVLSLILLRFLRLGHVHVVTWVSTGYTLFLIAISQADTNTDSAVNILINALVMIGTGIVLGTRGLLVMVPIATLVIVLPLWFDQVRPLFALQVSISLLTLYAVSGLIGKLIGNSLQQMIERVRAEERKRTQADRKLQSLNLIYRFSSDLFMVLDLDGRCLQASPSITRLLGYVDRDVFKNNVNEYVHPDDLQGHEDFVTALKEVYKDDGTSHNLQARLRRKDGSYRWFSFNTFLYGKHVYVIGHDIQAYKRLNDRRVELEAEQRTIRERERLVSIVSHDFRTPMTVIQSSTELLRRYIENDRLTRDKLQKHLDKIAEQSNYMSRMINQFLSYKALIQDLSYEPQTLDLVPFCRDIVELAEQTLETNHTLVYTSDQRSLVMSFDPNLMRQALTNLLNNAVKYSPDATTVRLELQKHKDHVLIHVHDEGMGIAEDEIEKLFQPFTRSEAVASIDGTGIGLSVVQQIVQYHGGAVTVDSTPGKGTTFTVWLPLSQDAS